MPALDPTLLTSEIGCYSCLGIPNEEAFKLGLLSRIASGGAPIPPPVIPSIVLTDLVLMTSAVAGVSFVTAIYTPAANSLLLAIVINEAASFLTPASLVGNGLTWVLVKTIGTIVGKNGFVLSVYRAMGNAPSAGALTVNFVNGSPQDSCICRVIQFSNVDTIGVNGSGAIVQSAQASVLQANPRTLNLAAMNLSGRNAVISFGANSINPYGLVSKVGWTNDFDTGVTGSLMPISGSGTYQLNSVDNAISLTGTVSGLSIFCSLIAAEIKAI